MPLGNVGAGPGKKGRLDVVLVFMQRQDYHLCSTLYITETSRSCESAHHWHRNIEYQHVRIEPESSVNRLFPVFDGPDNLEQFAKPNTKLCSHSWVIVSEQYSDVGHPCLFGRAAACQCATSDPSPKITPCSTGISDSSSQVEDGSPSQA
jgi:hypothetical protein